MNFKEEKARFTADGAEAKRAEYNLTPDSIVFDVGGYKGDWAHLINDKYGSFVYVFEPVELYYNNIVKRFADNPKIKVFKLGLGGSTREEGISTNGDSASIFGNVTEQIQIKDIYEFLSERERMDIDLIKINIEGAEFELLDRMIDTGCVDRFNNIQIQFHTFVPNCEYRRSKIIDSLNKTHKCDWEYTWVWESWSKNGN